MPVFDSSAAKTISKNSLLLGRTIFTLSSLSMYLSLSNQTAICKLLQHKCKELEKDQSISYVKVNTSPMYILELGLQFPSTPMLLSFLSVTTALQTITNYVTPTGFEPV